MSTLDSIHPDPAAGDFSKKHHVDSSDTNDPDYPSKKTRVEEKKLSLCLSDMEFSDDDEYDDDFLMKPDGIWVSLVPKKGYYKSCLCFNHDPCICRGKIAYLLTECFICHAVGVLGEHEPEECPGYSRWLEKRKEYEDGIAALELAAAKNNNKAD